MVLMDECEQTIQANLKYIHQDFINESQHDAHEFFNCLILNLQNAIPDIFSDFKITTKVFFECKNCGYERPSEESTDPILHLHLGPDTTDIQSLVDKYYQSEEAENVPCTNMCKTDSGTSIVLRKEKVQEPPNVLFIHLKRYEFYDDKSHKIKSIIKPSTLINFHGSSYRLKSIVQHNGEEANSGHYTTVLYLDNKWIECNDNVINSNSGTIDEEGYIYVYEISRESILTSTPLQVTKNATTKSRHAQKNKEPNTTEVDNDIQTLKRKPNDKNEASVSKKLKNKKSTKRSLQAEFEHNSSNDINSAKNEINVPQLKRKPMHKNSGALSKKTKCSTLNETSRQPNMENDGETLENQQQILPETNTPLCPQSKNKTAYTSSELNQNIGSEHQTSGNNEATNFERLYINREEKHLHLLKGDFSHNSEQDNPLYEANVKSDEYLNNLELSELCEICMECWYDLHIGKRNKMCTRCSNDRKRNKFPKILKFSKENGMHPGEVPDELKDLSFIELAAIKLI